MFNKILVVFFLSMWKVGTTLNCHKVCYLERVGTRSWLGSMDWITPVATNSSGWVIRMEFSDPFNGVGVWEGFVRYNGTERWALIRNRGESDAELEEGERKRMRFRVNYGIDARIPRVISLRFQRDHELCENWTRKRYSFRK